MRSSTLLFALVALIVPAVLVQTTVSENLTIVESLPEIPRGWKQISSVPAAKRLKFRIAIKQTNSFQFEQHVLAISTPGHLQYGKHMSRDELKSFLRPSTSITRAVTDWLLSEGILPADIKDDGNWISFSTSTSEAERILDTIFYYYESSFDGVRKIRTLQYSVPKSVLQYIQLIQPTTRFGGLRAQRATLFETGRSVSFADAEQWSSYSSKGFNASFCNTTITTDCLKQLYNVNGFQGDPKNCHGNKFGITGYLKNYPKYNDLDQFLKSFLPNADPKIANFTNVLINGGLALQNDTIDSDTEANLDTQYGIALSYATPTFFFSTGGLAPLVPDADEPAGSEDSNEPYLDTLHYLLALPDDLLPFTLTTSYGEDEQSVLETYTNATCSLFAQLGARGVSVIFSSGDTGVGSACQTNDGKNTTRFMPTFPGACPFITSVGGTYQVQPERAAPFSSGGFSDRFPRPAYQDDAVLNYLHNLGNQWEGLYNRNGRGFPDVAAQAVNYSVVDRGRVRFVSGTSTSAPTFAGMITLLNGARLARGERPLGFLNPWIYGSGSAGMNDIVDGGSRGCIGTDIYTGMKTPYVPYASWNATPGWDPVTGLGTPDFSRLLQAALLWKNESSTVQDNTSTTSHAINSSLFHRAMTQSKVDNTTISPHLTTSRVAEPTSQG